MTSDRELKPMEGEPEHAGPVDRVLRDFYRQEMPAPWPALQLSETPSPARPRLWSLGRSYLSLAASLLLLVGGLATASAVLRNEPAPARPGYRPTEGMGRRLNENDDPAAPAKSKDRAKPVPMPNVDAMNQ